VKLNQPSFRQNFEKYRQKFSLFTFEIQSGGTLKKTNLKHNFPKKK